MPDKKWTIEMSDKTALINIINAMFKDGIPEIVIQASRLNTLDRQLKTISGSLRNKSEKLKLMRGKKRYDLMDKGTAQYYLFNKLVKEREELLSILRGTDFDPLREAKGTGLEDE